MNSAVEKKENYIYSSIGVSLQMIAKLALVFSYFVLAVIYFQLQLRFAPCVNLIEVVIFYWPFFALVFDSAGPFGLVVCGVCEGLTLFKGGMESTDLKEKYLCLFKNAILALVMTAVAGLLPNIVKAGVMAVMTLLAILTILFEISALAYRRVGKGNEPAFNRIGPTLSTRKEAA
jgi:hypothetical protein